MDNIVPEFELGTFVLSGPGQVWHPSALQNHVDQLLRHISELGESQEWRRLTCMEAGIQATGEGLICVLHLCPSPQAHLDMQFRTADASETARAILQERTHWLRILKSAQFRLARLRLARALSATSPFAEGQNTSIPDAIDMSAAMRKTLENLGRRPGKLRLRSDDSVVQLEFHGFGGYTWSDVVEIVGLPYRTSFGVRIDLTSTLLAGDFHGRQVQIRYEGLSLPIQAMLDQATRHRSKVVLRGRVGRRETPANSSLVFQPEAV